MQQDYAKVEKVFYILVTSGIIVQKDEINEYSIITDLCRFCTVLNWEKVLVHSK